MKHLRFYAKTGAIAGLLIFVLYLLAIAFSFEGTNWFALPYYALSISFIAWKVRSYRRSLPDAKMAYDMAFKLIFLSLVFCSLTSNILTYVHDAFRPEFVQEQVKKMHQDFIDKGGDPNTINLTEKILVSPFRILITLLTQSILYAFCSLILAIFLKKEKKSAAV